MDEEISASRPLSDKQITDHTAGIWQTKDIEYDGTEIRSDFHKKYAENDFAAVFAARVRGKAHKHNGTYCDDYFETALAENLAAAAVCDGAGSKMFSRIGARAAAEAAVGYIKSGFEKLFCEEPSALLELGEPLGSDAFMAACAKAAAVVQGSAKAAFEAQKKAVDEIKNDENYIKKLGREPSLADLSSTFLAAAALPVNVGGSRQILAVSVQIGDGCVCALDSKASLGAAVKLLGEADSGEFSGETDFLCEKNVSDGALAARTRVSRGDFDYIFLMTDGVADDYFPANPMAARFYLDLLLNGIIKRGKSEKNGEILYAKRLFEEALPQNEALERLWNKKDELSAAQSVSGNSPEDRLCVWLDAYSERTSFDDRTAAVIRFGDIRDV